jgi:uncharacterized repeat protein (TIGR03803 family)
MQVDRFSLGLRTALTTLALVLFATSTWAADHEKVLHSFYSAGYNPTGNLIMDAAGNLFGEASRGGIYDRGIVFELTPREGGGWTEHVLYSFGSGTDGAYPGGGLIMDGAGNFYGTTNQGGIHQTCYEETSCGTVFELSPREGGGWTEQVLHSFGGGTDGVYPEAGLIMDGAGNLYGTTYQGGIHQTCYGNTTCGTVFELSPREGGGWTEQVLHSFADGTDGAYPTGSLITDTAGNLYGTTPWGGIHCDPYGCGTVFELSPREGGGWTERLLHSFGEGNDGIGPAAGLIFDAAGNLYGTTSGGGIHSFCDEGTCGGTAFELSPRDGGGWTEKVLHSFGEEDGSNPASGLIFDSAGNLYGTTPYGGIHPACGTDTACGTAFELMPREGGGWTEKTLHSFGFHGDDDGNTPFDALIMDRAGNLYGTTGLGGIYGSGTVFEITPAEVSGIHVQD